MSTAGNETEAERLFAEAKELASGSGRFIRDKRKSFESFLGAHELGNIKGTFGLALAWFEGNGTERDTDRAEQLVRPIIAEVERRVEASEAAFELILGDMYSFGLGKPADYAKAFSLYQLAAEQGCLEAQCNLGYAYRTGQGVEGDLRMMAHWWLRSAEAGYAHSCRDIGECYFIGDGVQRDLEKAVYWFRRASELNYSHGTCDLAYCHLFGVGAEQDVAVATELYQRGLTQDPDRTMRDLLAANIDVDVFLNEGRIAVTVVRSITEVPEAEYASGRYFMRASVEELDPGAFTGCSTLRKFLVDTRNLWFRVIDGVLYSHDCKELVRYPNGKEDTVFVCPPSVERIGIKAFQNARHLLQVELSEGLVEIGEGAFDDCKQLEQVRFHGALNRIGPWAFHGCDAIRQFHLPASVRSIGKYALGSCEALRSIEVHAANPAYATASGCLLDKAQKLLLQYAIGRTEALLEIPAEVEVIGFRACSDAFYLRSVVVGERVVEIGEKAFYFATDLREVRFLGPPVKKLGVRVFDRTHEELRIVVPAGFLSVYQADERFAGLVVCTEG